jgi:creatinine amidohydrolase
MTCDTGVWLEDLTWLEAKARFEAGALVVVPIGAAAKAHGPHLPLKTDALTARVLAQKLVERLPVIAAPVVGFGFYPAFTSFAGSQHLSAPTFKALLAELLASLRGHGVRRIVILNTGVSTEKPIDEVAAGADDVLVLHMRGLGAAADKLLDVPEGGHADERETSVMLALEPRSVRLHGGPDGCDRLQGRAHPGSSGGRHGCRPAQAMAGSGGDLFNPPQRVLIL